MTSSIVGLKGSVTPGGVGALIRSSQEAFFMQADSGVVPFPQPTKILVMSHEVWACACVAMGPANTFPLSRIAEEAMGLVG